MPCRARSGCEWSAARGAPHTGHPGHSQAGRRPPVCGLWQGGQLCLGSSVQCNVWLHRLLPHLQARWRPPACGVCHGRLGCLLWQLAAVVCKPGDVRQGVGCGVWQGQDPRLFKPCSPFAGQGARNDAAFICTRLLKCGLAAERARLHLHPLQAKTHEYADCYLDPQALPLDKIKVRSPCQRMACPAQLWRSCLPCRTKPGWDGCTKAACSLCEVVQPCRWAACSTAPSTPDDHELQQSIEVQAADALVTGTLGLAGGPTADAMRRAVAAAREVRAPVEGAAHFCRAPWRT